MLVGAELDDLRLDIGHFVEQSRINLGALI